MTKWTLRAAALGLVGVTLAACGGGGNDNTAVNTPTPVTPKLEDALGTNFGADFRSTAAEPATVAAGDTVAVSFTTEPTALHS